MVAVLFDVSRLFMRASGLSPTGIDRVTEAYGRWLLSRRDVEVIPICSWGGFVWPMDRDFFETIVKDKGPKPNSAGADWPELVAALQAPAGTAKVLRAKLVADPRRATWARYLGVAWRTLANWRPTRIGPGAVYINVSHFGLEQPGLLTRLSAGGAKIVVMIHDLIPLLHPEYCSPSAYRWHQRRIQAVLKHADLIITNSGATAGEVAAFAKQCACQEPPIRVAPLGLETAFVSPTDDSLSARPYFLCVGTLEPRKNIVFLLTLWRRLSERMGEATPPLVLAGRRGWETEAIIDHLDRSPPIQRFVHEIGGLGDAELARLVGGATALLAPSFIEGFNLPVAEAFALATPVIASDIPVHRELAKGALLIDPLDGPAWLAAIEAAILTRPDIGGSAPPSWAEHFELVVEALGWPISG